MEKTALITGAGRGIGKRTALTLAKSGYNIVINYNKSKESALNLQTELELSGTKTLLVKCDISNELEVKQMVTDILKKFNSIDVLVNNSAISIDSMFENKTAEDFQKTLNTNLVGTFLVSKYVGETMCKNKSGKIINIASTNGINTYFPMCLEYDASKAGVISLTHNLAMQFAPYVNVNAIAPGFIATESEIKDMNAEFVKSEEEKIFLRRAGTEQNVADLINFLASDKASYINNEIIRIDGGIYGNF